jgi:hypothetical protein
MESCEMKRPLCTTLFQKNKIGKEPYVEKPDRICQKQRVFQDCGLDSLTKLESAIRLYQEFGF